MVVPRIEPGRTPPAHSFLFLSGSLRCARAKSSVLVGRLLARVRLSPRPSPGRSTRKCALEQHRFGAGGVGVGPGNAVTGAACLVFLGAVYTTTAWAGPTVSPTPWALAVCLAHGTVSRASVTRGAIDPGPCLVAVCVTRPRPRGCSRLADQSTLVAGGMGCLRGSTARRCVGVPALLRRTWRNSGKRDPRARASRTRRTGQSRDQTRRTPRARSTTRAPGLRGLLDLRSTRRSARRASSPRSSSAPSSTTPWWSVRTSAPPRRTAWTRPVPRCRSWAAHRASEGREALRAFSTHECEGCREMITAGAQGENLCSWYCLGDDEVGRCRDTSEGLIQKNGVRWEEHLVVGSCRVLGRSGGGEGDGEQGVSGLLGV